MSDEWITSEAVATWSVATSALSPNTHTHTIRTLMIVYHSHHCDWYANRRHHIERHSKVLGVTDILTIPGKMWIFINEHVDLAQRKTTTNKQCSSLSWFRLWKDYTSSNYHRLAFIFILLSMKQCEEQQMTKTEYNQWPQKASFIWRYGDNEDHGEWKPPTDCTTAMHCRQCQGHFHCMDLCG